MKKVLRVLPLILVSETGSTAVGQSGLELGALPLPSASQKLGLQEGAVRPSNGLYISTPDGQRLSPINVSQLFSRLKARV